MIGSVMGRLARRWPAALIVVSTLLIVASFRMVLGANDWAGLGQWVGGLGALFAALAALDIAKKESGRENQREAERYRVHAYYVRGVLTATVGVDGFQVDMRNESPEPIVDVSVTAIHALKPGGEVLVVPCAGSVVRPVLLPKQQWVTWSVPSEHQMDRDLIKSMSGTRLVEIRYGDLGGARWRRVGERPPEPDDA